MITSTIRRQANADYELRFRSLFHPGRGYSFPCDAAGHVDIDTLNDRARCNYFFARTVIGREVAMPEVQPREVHPRERLQ
jgi:hypothetical protein